jgi:hypothetical protein
MGIKLRPQGSNSRAKVFGGLPLTDFSRKPARQIIKQ